MSVVKFNGSLRVGFYVLNGLVKDGDDEHVFVNDDYLQVIKKIFFKHLDNNMFLMPIFIPREIKVFCDAKENYLITIIALIVFNKKFFIPGLVYKKILNPKMEKIKNDLRIMFKSESILKDIEHAVL